MAYARITLDDAREGRRPALARTLASGAYAGQVGGLAFAFAAMVSSTAFLGQGFLSPLQVIAASVLGDHVPLATLDLRAAVIGVFVNTIPSLLWGLVFGATVWACKPKRGAALLWLGLTVGALALLVDLYVLVPLMSGSELGVLPLRGHSPRLGVWAEHIPLAVSALAHLAYGLTLSIHPWRYDPATQSFE